MADKHEQRRRDRLAPFVPLLVETLDAPAWQAMSHGAQMLYVALKRRYSIRAHNNGGVYLSQRRAVRELRSHHNEIARWFRELQFYGFIVLTTPGCLGIAGAGKAPHWRLTELGYQREPPTRDFIRWDGSRFSDTKSKPRAGIGARGVREMAHGGVREIHTPQGKTVLEMAHIRRR